MKQLAYRYHPNIEGLKINEDGTSVIFKEKEVRITKLERKGKCPARRVNIMSRTHSLPKLIAECWIGLRDADQVVQHIGDPCNDHYTNLIWARMNKKHGIWKSSIPDEKVPEIVAHLKNGKYPTELSRMYNTSVDAIKRIKKRYIAK